MRSRAPWPQMAAATVLVMVLPAVIVGVLSALGVITSVWVGLLLAVALSLALSSAGSAYWRRRATGDVLFSDLLLWGWLRRRRTERRLGRADELLRQAGTADSARKAELLRELGAALDAQDPYLQGHSRRVARYVTMIAQRMNLPDEQLERAKAAAAIHDVGKLRVPEALVQKPGRLTDAEFALMQQHAAAGAAMVESLDDPALTAAVRGHHERWDGSGYPDGLAGERIAVEARIISVADTFDAITSARPYRAAKPHAKALSVIADEADHQLDPEAAHAFISCYSDRRGAALWAGLASIPRQVASRLSTSPGELTGVLAAAVTPALVVAAGAAGSAAMTARTTDDLRAANQQTATPAGPTGTPQPSIPSSTATATATPGSTSPAAGAGQTATSTSTPAPGAGTVTGAGVGSSPPEAASVTPEPTAPPLAGTPEETLAAPPAELPLLPDLLPPIFPTATPSPTPVPPLPTATPTPAPTASPEPEPTPSPEPEPTPEPLPPLFPDNLPIFPPVPTPVPPSHTVDDCKNGGWIDLGYPNQGQCIADADKSKPDRPHQ